MSSKLEENSGISLRKRFLQSYIFALIQNSYIPKEEIKAEPILEKQEVKETEPEIPSIASTENMSAQIDKPETEIKKVPTPPTLPPLPSAQQLPPLPKFHENIAKIQLPSLPPPSENQIFPVRFGKITQILLDPTVFSVECPGPGKNLIVNKAGQIQAAPLILTKKEIDEVMDEISEKTRIPIVQGLFKAAVQDLIVTAVVSDYVGTRFIIQKRTPFR